MIPRDTRASRQDVIFGRDEVEALIAEGKSIVIVDNEVLKVDAWMPYHPGGDKAMKHMVGRDATDEVTVYGSLRTRLGCDFSLHV